MAAKEPRIRSAALDQLAEHLWAHWGEVLTVNGLDPLDLEFVVSARGAEVLAWAQGRRSWEWLCLLLAADLEGRRPPL